MIDQYDHQPRVVKKYEILYNKVAGSNKCQAYDETEKTALF